jgi:hypothetical protein
MKIFVQQRVRQIILLCKALQRNLLDSVYLVAPLGQVLCHSLLMEQNIVANATMPHNMHITMM